MAAIVAALHQWTEARPSGKGAAMKLQDRVLFVDGEAIVIDKPEGLPVDTPRAGGDSVEARLGELKLGFHRFPVPMHRLDRDTSGCLLLARNPKARSRFQQAFETGAVSKSYLAVVDGPVQGDEGVIDLPVAKVSSAAGGWRMVVEESGKRATTRWRKVAEAEGQTLVEFRPTTGRTHQIRVHAARGLGAPIFGDPVYSLPDGAELGTMTLPNCGMLLHAWRLVVPREPKEPIDVTAPVPDRFGRWLDYL
jgi:tRNA pseudouridine32 synthase/23S rRNA pseudouridine746 synthase